MLFGKSFFRKIYKIHVYAGLFVAVHFAIFALSGLILLFKDEIQGHKVQTAAANLTQEQITDGYQLAFNNAVKANPTDRLLAFFPDDEDPNLIHSRMGIDGATKLRGARKSYFDLTTGQELKKAPKASAGFFDWILQLHREFLLGSNGKLYVGFVGCVYVFMLISGFFIYGQFMRGRKLGDLRKKTIPKMVDLHKFLGVITFGWGLVIGLSGVFLAFNGVLIKYFQYQSLQHLSQQYQHVQSAGDKMAPFKDIIETALKAKEHYTPSYISFPDTEFGIPGHFLVLINGTDAITQRISQLLVINSTSAQLAETVELPIYLKFVLLSEPLHFGDYGGIFLKILWAFFTLSSFAVVMLGIFSFAQKRQNRNSGGANGASSKKSTSADIDTPTTRSSKHDHVQSLQTRNKLDERNSVGKKSTAMTEKYSLLNFTYIIPCILAVATIVGTVVLLFTSGAIAFFALLILTLPALTIFLARQKNG